MKQKGFWLGVLLFSFLFVPAAFSGGRDHGEMYFGHVSYIETDKEGTAPLVFRDGLANPETAVLNLPLGAGDIIQTFDGPRCEVQFDNGTIVRLDSNTKLKIETLLANSLSTAKTVSNLLLAQGQVYVMYKKYNSLEIFQVITPHAAVKLNHNSVALIQLPLESRSAVQVERGRADLLYGPDQFNVHRKKVNTKERMMIWGDSASTVEPAEYIADSDFKAWNESVNENFKTFHEENLLPKPVQNLPKAVFYFAQRYGNAYGEWLWHDLYGYVWRPYFNDYYPWGSWTPYFYGNWASYRGQLFWIPDEPWGWVPYHLGIWMWDKTKGWVWLPGSIFASSWAVWDFYFGYYSWRPWSLLDWMYASNYFTYGRNWGNSWFPGRTDLMPSFNILTTIRKDQLKRKANPALPLPKEMKKAFNTMVNALKRGDENALESLLEVSRRSVFLKKNDLGLEKWQSRVVGRDQVLKNMGGQPLPEKPEPPSSSVAVSADALRTIHRRQLISEIQMHLNPAAKDLSSHAPALARDFDFNRELRQVPHAPRVERGGEQAGRPRAMDSSSRPSLRFRDWNPDIRTGINLGVDIRYDTRRNEIVAPELGLRSGDAGPRMRLGEGTFSGTTSMGSGGGAVGSGQATSGQAASGQAAPAQRSTGAPTHKESSSGGGEAKKN
jgi:hypothetical protein